MSADDVPWRSLHPASVLVNLIPRGWLVIRQAWPLLLVWIAGGRARGEQLADVSVLVVLLALSLASSIIHWFTLRYRFVGERMEITSGLLSRQTRVIAPRKVQNVEVTRNVFQRMAGLAEVRIETASDAGVEGLLSALSLQEAHDIVERLAAARGATATAERPDDVIVSHSPGEILLYAATSMREGIAALILAAFFEVTGSIDAQRSARLGAEAGWGGVVAVVALVVGAGWAFGAVTAAIRHAGFRLLRTRDALVAEEGMFTRRHVELPLAKIQRVAIHSPWLRRNLGFSSIHIETAVHRAGEGGVERALTIVPVAREDVIDAITAAVLAERPTPGTADDDVTLESDADHLLHHPLRPPHPRAVNRALVRGTLLTLVPSIFLTAWSWPWGALALVSVPASALVAWLDVRAQGWLVTPRHVVVRQGYLDRVTTIIARDRLQAADVHQGPLLARYALGEVVLSVAGGSVTMPLLDMEQAFALATRLSAEACPARRSGPARPAVGRDSLTPPGPAVP